jgi:3-hydroxybutyryl-CoA dehydratase
VTEPATVPEVGVGARPARPQALDFHWEDLEVGHRATSPGRTVTEADLVGFAGLSGDFNQLHMDAVYAATKDFGGRRVVHGMLGMAIGSGLLTRTWLGAGTQRNMVAMLEIDWHFLGPVFIGDTLTVAVEVIEVRPTSKPDRGLVRFLRQLYNQDGALVQEGTSVFLMGRRP